MHPDFWLPIFAVLAAPACGSFAAAAADRLPRGEPVLFGRSRCRSCGASLAARDLLPILSWLILRGRCRFCGAGIGMRPLVIEILALALGGMAALILPWDLLPASLVLMCALLILALVDFDHLYLPLPVLILLPLAGFGVNAALVGGWPVDALIGAAAGGAAFAALAVGWRLARGETGLGDGDPWLLAGGGAWLGWVALPGLVALAAGGTLLVVLSLRLAGRPPPRKVPFAPGLCTAIWISWLFGPMVPAWMG